MKIAIMGSIHQDGIDKIKDNSFDYFEITNFETNSLINELGDVDAIVLRTAELKENVLSHCKKLKIIARHGVGYDNVDSKYLDENKIALGITGTANAVSVAEHVMTMFLYLTKKINNSDLATKRGNFNERNTLPEFFELYKKNILILGFGRIGQELAKRCIGFDTKIYIFDPFVEKKVIEEKNYFPVLTKEEGLKIADYISIHMPLNEKTKNFISYDEFKILKKNAIIVNSARGGIINEEALYLALKNNYILGAGIDVFTQEPPKENHPFFDLDNIVLSPHNAALTLECKKRMSIESCENIIYYLNKDKKLNKENIVNKKIIDLL